MDQIAIARLEERVASLTRDVADGRAETKIAHSEILSRMGALESRERERNGHINDLVRRNLSDDQRWAEHMAFSKEYAEDVHQLKRQHEDQGVRAALIRSQWVMLSAGAAIGVSVFEGLNEIMKLVGG